MAFNTGFIYLLLIWSATKAAYYIQTGTDKHFCGFKCYQPHGILKLRCNHTTLLAAECSNWVPKIHHHVDPRIILNSSSGCWMLKDAQKNYTGTYQIFYYDGSDILVSKPIEIIGIIVLDAVKIKNITCNSSVWGSDVSLEVQFSGGNASVLWELDGGSLPSRYLLKDDNQTLIIQNVGREDAQRMLAVWVKNPISEDTLEYHLVIKDKRRQYRAEILTGSFIFLVIVIFAVLACGIFCEMQYGRLEAFCTQMAYGTPPIDVIPCL